MTDQANLTEILCHLGGVVPGSALLGGAVLQENYQLQPTGRAEPPRAVLIQRHGYIAGTDCGLIQGLSTAAQCLRAVAGSYRARSYADNRRIAA